MKAIVSEAVDSSLQKLGVDTHHPELMRADLVALREWRETYHLIRHKGIGTIVTTVVTFLITALAVGVGFLLHRPAG